MVLTPAWVLLIHTSAFSSLLIFQIEILSLSFAELWGQAVKLFEILECFLFCLASHRNPNTTKSYVGKKPNTLNVKKVENIEVNTLDE